MQVGSDIFAGLGDEGHVRVAGFAQRRGHADGDRVNFVEGRIFSRGADVSVIDVLAQLGVADIRDIALAAVDHLHFFLA